MIGKRVAVGGLLLAAGMALALARPAAATNARALHLLAEGTVHAQRREYTMAERRLRAALNADPELAAAHRWLGRVYREQGMGEEALSALAHAVLIEPRDDESREAIAALLEGAFPRWLDRDTVAALPVGFVETEIRLTDPRLEQVRLTDGAQAVVRRTMCTASPAAREAAAPGVGGRCDQVLHGYVLTAQRWVLRFRVHYASPRVSRSGADYGPLAADCLDLLLYARAAAEAYLGSALRGAGVVEVWLCEDGAPGGEAWANHLSLHGIQAERPPGEWARQVMHEYGHIALPGIDHYREPEAWANGPLGERLLTRWLLANPENPMRLLQGVSADEHARRRVAPVVRRFLAQGPRSALAGEATAEAMEWYLGLALYVEAALGPKALSEAMTATRGARAEAFLRAVERVMAQRAERGMTLEAAGGGEALWVYLPPGRWQVGGSEVVGGWQRVAATGPVSVRRADGEVASP